MVRRIDITGRRFGRWTVLEYEGNRNGGSWYSCKCDCGTIKSTTYDRLKLGQSKSCGCLASEMRIKRNLKHGQCARGKETREWLSWRNMIGRCQNPKNTAYMNYGGRGIKVCDRWMEFTNFFEDMGKCPKNHTLDRIDVNGDYCPENCRWASYKQQARNTRKNLFFTVKGETKTLAEWAEIYQCRYGLVQKRVLQLGWDIEEALTIPPLPTGARYKCK